MWTHNMANCCLKALPFRGAGSVDGERVTSWAFSLLIESAAYINEVSSCDV
jgi:hypothetical protein